MKSRWTLTRESPLRTSDSIAKIAPALLAAQKAVGGTVKDKTGKILTKTGSYEYKYSDLSSVLDEIKGPLNDNGIMLLQSPTADSSGVCVITRLLHESGEWIEESLYMPVTQSTPQAYGSAITYCRRYSAQSMVGLKAEDDDGKAASVPPVHDPAEAIRTANISGRSVLEAEFNKMAPEEQDFIRSHAAEVEKLFANKGDVFGYVESQHFDQEEKMALAFLLPSNIRAALKKARAEMQPPQKEAA